MTKEDFQNLWNSNFTGSALVSHLSYLIVLILVAIQIYLGITFKHYMKSLRKSLLIIFFVIADQSLFAQIDTVTSLGRTHMAVMLDNSNFDRIENDLSLIAKSPFGKKLGTIEISGSFSVFPKGLFEYVGCKEIIVNSTKSLIVTSSFGLIRGLESLRITCAVNSVDSTLVLPELRYLYLGNYKSKEFPEAFLKSQHIIEITINEGRFKTLPTGILNLKNLKVLNLSNNRLELLPAEISQLKELEVLSLNNNRLTAVPDSLCKLFSLRELYIQNNPKLIIDKEQRTCIMSLPHFENLFE